MREYIVIEFVSKQFLTICFAAAFAIAIMVLSEFFPWVLIAAVCVVAAVVIVFIIIKKKKN